MGFYLRKAFSAGPVRFNLSKSGPGVSVGVPGFRVGAGPGKSPYVHAGRYGLYYRKSLHGTGALGDRSAPGGPAKVERLAASQVFETPQIHEPGTGAFSSPPGVRRGWLLVPPVYLVLAVIHWRRQSRAERYLGELLALAKGLTRLDEETALGLERLKAQYRLPERVRAWAHEAVYEKALALVVADRVVTADELAWLALLEIMLGLPQHRALELKADWYRAIYLEAVADRVLTEEEEEQLDSIRSGLEIPAGEIISELTTIERLKKAREVGRGELVAIDPSLPLGKGEVCYFEGPGRLLSRKTMSRYRRQGVVYHNVGLLTQREGVLLITSKRLLLVGNGATALALARILDVEVDPDQNLISITSQKRRRPLYISTPESMVAGALLHRLSQEGMG